MFKLNEFARYMAEARDFLEEKLIQYNNGKQYGQVVFIAGGAGSGKGFAITNFMEGNKFKIRDVDEMKLAFLKLDKLKGKYPEIRGLDLKKPEDVGTLHAFVSAKGIKDRTLSLLLANKDPRYLPNIIFDITAKSLTDITKVVPRLIEAGYNPRDIHVTWILTNFNVAAKNNAGRDRVVPEKILMKTHTGAAQTMDKVIMKNALPRSMVDGGIYVVLNNRENTVFWDKPDSSKGNLKFNVKSFSYLTIKKPGKTMTTHDSVMGQLKDWIDKNAPKGWDNPESD